MKVLSIEMLDAQNFKSYGALDLDDAVEVIEEILLLTHHDVEAMQKFGVSPRRIDIGLTENAFYTDSVQEAMEGTVRISSGRIVSIGEPNQIVTDVYVKHAPMDWSRGRFARIFSFYGEIRQIDSLSIRKDDLRNKYYIRNA